MRQKLFFTYQGQEYDTKDMAALLDVRPSFLRDRAAGKSEITINSIDIPVRRTVCDIPKKQPITTTPYTLTARGITTDMMLTYRGGKLCHTSFISTKPATI